MKETVLVFLSLAAVVVFGIRLGFCSISAPLGRSSKRDRIAKRNEVFTI